MIRVIVADDEEKVSQLICNLVDWDALDMEVVGIARNGVEALALVEQKIPDVLLTDIRMPGYDGLELVRRAKEVNPKLEVIIISGYRYFDYAQTALKYGVSEYLLKPINKVELTQTLEKMRWKYRNRAQLLSREERLRQQMQSDREQLRAGFFVALQTTTSRPEPMAMADINRDFRYNFKDGIFRVMVLKADGDPAVLLGEGYGVLQEKSEGILREMLQPFCYEMELSPEGEGQTWVLLNYATTGTEELQRRLRAILAELRVQNNMFSDLAFTIALGSEEKTAGALSCSWQAAGHAMAQRLVQTGDILEGVQKNVQPMPQSGVLLAEAGRALEAALETQDEEAVCASAKGFTTQVMQLAGISGAQVYSLAQEFWGMYCMLLQRVFLGVGRQESFSEEFWKAAAFCRTAQKLLKLMESCVVRLYTVVAEDQRTTELKPIRQAKNYIQTNYMQPLTLEEVGTHAGFNPSYFSVLFKKETGQNFSEYLSGVRMNKAKEMLRDTKFSVAKIAEEVGYADLKYFVKTFKKITGIKPGEFRKLYS